MTTIYRPDFLNRLATFLGAKTSDIPRTLLDQIVVTIPVGDLLAVSTQINPMRETLRIEGITDTTRAIAVGNNTIDAAASFTVSDPGWLVYGVQPLVDTVAGFAGSGQWHLSRENTRAAGVADNARTPFWGIMQMNTAAGALSIPPTVWLPYPLRMPAGEQWFLNSFWQGFVAGNVSYGFVIQYVPF